MNPIEQLKHLAACEIPSFSSQTQKHLDSSLKAAAIEIFQMNVGKLCNLQCKHCHVEAGPDRTENMTEATFRQCAQIIKDTGVSTVDLTGGAPEMNPFLEAFITEIKPFVSRIIVRSNLTVLTIPKYAHFIDFFAENGVEVVASLPATDPKKTDIQRGTSVFKKSIQVLQALNEKGYATPGSELTLNLVHNPVGAYLPGSQSAMESDYKRRLKEAYDVTFNQLFCITNLPISRYLEYLIESDNYGDYMSELLAAFNPTTLDNVMCRNTISIGYDGALYDCDFNQMLELKTKAGSPQHISEFDMGMLKGRDIVVGNHCYGCTAGAGSSCQGSLG